MIKVLGYFLGVIALVSLAFLDSTSWTPTIIFTLSVVLLLPILIKLKILEI